MTIRRAPWAMAVAGIGLAIVALSFVPEWLVHHREMRGEGFRTLTIGLHAWQLRSVPVVSAGVIATAAVALAALLAPARLAGWLRALAVVPLGLFLAAAWPIAHFGHVSSVSVTPGWALVAAIAGTATMTALVTRRSGPGLARAGAAIAVLVFAGGLGVGARFVGLAQVEADRPHWTAGTYERDDATLTLGDGEYAVGERWSGSFESSGLTMILVGDPACPDARGAYRIFDGGGGDIRWELIVDTCAEGGRAEDLVGVWQRRP